MRIVKESRVKAFMQRHPKARAMLERWVRLTRAGRWAKFQDLRQTFPDADLVAVASGKNAVVFDINGNAFRLIAAVHFMRPSRTSGTRRPRWSGGRVYVFHFLTHAEYDADTWKENL